MGATLYILRQQHHHISPSLFEMSDAHIDVVFMEQDTSLTYLGAEGVMVGGGSIKARSSCQALTYDDLVEKIFSSEHVVVL
ncbi:MAG: hypothetical protein ABI684_12240 [Nitrospirota bacterium]